MDYTEFLRTKTTEKGRCGFKPLWLPDFLFPFQHPLVCWAIEQGRGALFEECGLGKTPQQLVFGENVVRKTNKNVLILTPLAVAPQTIREGEKFGVEVRLSRNGKAHKGITITNYQQLEKFDPRDFVGVICDESSCLKDFDSVTRKIVTEFMRRVKYRLLCTATPAPNDYMELGTSSEALGVMGRNQMLGMFFVNDGESTQQWRIKGHAKSRFWRWVASWARAVRKPSDLGFPDGKFKLPPLNIHHHVLDSGETDGFLPRLAKTLSEQRVVQRETVRERCEKAAEVLPRKGYGLVWCHLNPEGDLLTKLIPGAVQVAGADPDDVKEERLTAFAKGEIRVLVCKPSIAGFGLNLQHCSNVTYFPSYSHERYYQAIRRCWRFGQENPVECHLVYGDREKLVADAMLRKEKQSIEMYEGIIREMSAVLKNTAESNGQVEMEIPKWLRG